MRARPVRRTISVLVTLALGACANPDLADVAQQNVSNPGLLPGEEIDPFNVEYSFEITDKGEFVNLGSEKIPESDYSYDPLSWTTLARSLMYL